MIEDFVLASRVKLQLATHERTKGLELEVTAQEGVVKITGQVLMGGMFSWGGRESIRNDLIEVSKTVPGVQKVVVAVEGKAVPLE
jgi:osmotically-inducible protein OsmY